MPFQSHIIVRLKGGLGNQLYQYAVGRAVSQRMNRPLLIDTRQISGEGPHRHYDLGVFCIHGNLITPLLQWCIRWACSARLGKAFRILCPLVWGWEYITDREAGYDPSIFNPRKGTLVLDGYWQSYRYFEEYRDLLLREITFRKPPDATNQQMIDQLNAVESIAVHVRRGDYVSSPLFNANLGTCSLEYYHNAVAEISRRVKNPHFFVFTDDPAWARNNLAMPGPMQVVDHNLGKADYEDLRLMTHCKYFIIANSSFSWWGAWLGRFPGKIVIAPKRWFNVDASPIEDRIPLTWLRM
jgi:hypothetical protein